MTITRDELDRLRAERPIPNATVTYDIDGPIQTTVKSNLDTERFAALSRGERMLQEQVELFRNEMTFKCREGHSRADFNMSADQVPRSDQKIAEGTWRANAIDAHKRSLSKAADNFRTAMSHTQRQERKQ